MNQNTVNYDVLSPVKFIWRAADVFADKTAVVYGETRYTYAEFFERINRLASALQAAGIQKGDKVAYLAPNTPPVLEAHYAVPLIGAVLVTVNIRLSSSEIGYIINHSEAKVVVVDNAFAGLVTPVLDQLEYAPTFVNICDVSDELPLDGPGYEAFVQGGSPEPMVCQVADEREMMTLNYTSGTTGEPKGVMYHHRGGYLNALGEIIEFNLTPDSIYLWTLPMFHCNGWCYTWAVTAVGATHVCLRQVDPGLIYEIIETEEVTHLCAAPTILISLASYAKDNEVRLSHTLHINTAGAPPAPQVIMNMEATGADVIQCYGLTEVYGPHTICTWKPRWNDLAPEEKAQIKARQGVAYVTAGYVDVIDAESGQPVPRDGQTIGEIVMRGNNVMLGYYKDAAATDKAFAGGWFHSGDLAVRHPDGYIQIMDRQKDIIISGGENISTVEVENTIYKHPEVIEVAVVSTPHEKWGEVPKAFVTVRAGSPVTAGDIIAFCKENLARYKAPNEVVFGEPPKTATGQIPKVKLRHKELAGRERRVA